MRLHVIEQALFATAGILPLLQTLRDCSTHTPLLWKLCTGAIPISAMKDDFAAPLASLHCDHVFALILTRIRIV
jgi:hypothetical protein